VSVESLENQIIPSHPNTPAHQNDDVHEEAYLQLSFERVQHLKRIPRRDD
jgi:hypothetical protein